MAILELKGGRPQPAPPPADDGRWRRWRLALLPASGLAAILLWEGAVRLAGYPPFILPARCGRAAWRRWATARWGGTPA
jgi:hypothetical protein